MKTRNALLIAAVAALMTSAPLHAQDCTTTRQNRADINELLEKRCHRMESQLKLDEASAAKFEPLYKEYLKEMRACRPTNCTKKDKSTCTDADKKDCIEKRLDCRERMIKTQKKYYKQFEKFLNADQLETLFSVRKQAGQKCTRGNKHPKQCSQSGHKRHTQCTNENHSCK